MSAIEGECALCPDTDWWYDELAGALVSIHQTPVATPAPDALLHPTDLTTWGPWADVPDDRASATARVVRALQARIRHESGRLSHGDYHPGNVLFVGERLTGVVDWSAATMAPAASDVAQCRTDLAIWAGGGAPDRFLAAYQRAAGNPVEDLGPWDVFHGDHALRHGRGWIQGFAEAGITVTADQLRERVAAFIDAALVGC
jgi:aminoglycoside phosphotransferase (APT) family kinase protein